MAALENYSPKQVEDMTPTPDTVAETDVKQGADKLADATDRSGQEIAELNKNPKLAQEEADKIVEGLPKTVESLTPDQQEVFINSVEKSIIDSNLDIFPGSDVPKNWREQLENYKDLRNNISKLSPDQQETLKKAEREAIQQITEESKDIIDGVKGDNSPDSTIDDAVPQTGGIGDVGSQSGGREDNL